MNRAGSSPVSGGCSGGCVGGSSAGGNASPRSREASDTIAHISHRPMAITRLSNASMNHANQIISCSRGCSSCPPPSIVRLLTLLHLQILSFRTPLSDIPEMSFFREGGSDREPGDLVAGLFDGALDLLLLGLPSFE